MKIIESKTEGKSPGRLSEDILVIMPDFIAVIDGVTPKSNFTYEGKSTGRLAAELAGQAVRELKGTEDCQTFIKRCNQKFHDFYEKVDFPYDIRSKGLQAAAVIYSEYLHEIWMIGDCQAMVDGREYLQPKRSDVILSQFRSLLMVLQVPASEARAKVEPWIVNATAFANKVGRPTLQQSEQDLDRLLKEDPQCCRLYESTKGLKPGNKSFDDRTYVRFQAGTL